MHQCIGGGIVDASMHRPEVLLMHQCIGGGIVDASIVLHILMHQAGIDASSRY
jgi:hypothetical protein